ncbi:MAG TPA: hypothetical protein DCG34_08905 [Clostridiales bacterium]|nr:hypothetical protein [Clostridiales bacterium]
MSNKYPCKVAVWFNITVDDVESRVDASELIASRISSMVACAFPEYTIGKISMDVDVYYTKSNEPDDEVQE